jgi:hypothetical protein
LREAVLLAMIIPDMLATYRLGVMGLPVDLATAAQAVELQRDIPDEAGASRLDDSTIAALDDAFGVRVDEERRVVEML